MNRLLKSARETNAGFTLLELMVSMAILLVISSAAIGGMTYFQKNYRSSEQRKSMQAQLRATVEQMSQEIGQAGLVPSGLAGNGSVLPGTLATLNGVIQIGATTLNVTNTLAMYPGEWLILDTPDLNTPLGAPQERVQILSLTSNSIQFTPATVNKHDPTVNPVPIIAQGVYHEGVWDAITVPSLNGTAGTLSAITIFGDINADGTMVIVKYQCPTTTPGPLLRFEYKAKTNSTCNPTAVPDSRTTLIDNVVFCQFTDTVFGTGLVKTGFVKSVGVSLTVQSKNPDAQIQNANAATYIIITKNVLNIQPRNIVNAYNMSSLGTLLTGNLSEDSYTNEFQSLPASLTPQGILSTQCMP